ncbi:uncharacterized protein METZ01_LOCUS134954 [marine metagenome]|uniref:Uncharacterized protein n=1 Tax=marine metagenome TaxID=408172 RepID=A0A381YYS9_9ZZZZ
MPRHLIGGYGNERFRDGLGQHLSIE